MDKPIAHIAEDGRVHDLYEHLTDTAKLASGFAVEFECGEWCYLVGLWDVLKNFLPIIDRNCGI